MFFSPRWRLLLVCLLLMALPLKGIAATGMLACCPDAGALPAAASGVAAAHGADGAADHAGHGEHAAADDTGVPHTGHHGADAKAKIGNLPPCCAGAVMSAPAALQALATAQAASEPIPALSHYHSADLAGRDKPPRR